MYDPITDHCPLCSRKLGLRARISGSNFCSAEHREQYLADNDAAILARLGAKRAPRPRPVHLPAPARVNAAVLALAPKGFAGR